MRLTRALLGLALAVVLLQWAGAFLPGPRAWGFHHWAFLPRPLLLLFGLPALLLLLPPVSSAAARALSPLARALAAGGRARPVAAAVLVVLAVAFCLARQRAFLLSDGELLIGTVREGLTPRAFTADTLGAFLQLWLNVLFVDVLKIPSETLSFRVASVASGLVWLGALFLAVGRLTPDGWGRLILGGLLALAGVTRLFYGYVETGPLLAAAMAIYLWAGIRLVQEGKGLPLATLAFLAAAALHVTGLLLLPSFLVLAFHWSGGKRDRLLRALLLVLAPTLFYMGFWFSQGGTLDSIRAVYAPFFTKFLPLLPPAGDPKRVYGLLSPDRWLDFLNEQFLLGPFALLALAAVLLAGGRRALPATPPVRFLLAVLAPILLLSVLFNRELGGARDWDLLAGIAAPAILLAGLALLAAGGPAPEAGPRARRGLPPFAAAGVTLLAASLFHLAGWVLVDAEAARSVRHFQALFTADAPVSRFARSYALEDVGHWHLGRGDVDQALPLFEEAARVDPANVKAMGTLGSLYSARGDLARALPLLEEVARRRPDIPGNHYNLGSARLSAGDAVEAARRFQETLRLNPQYLPAYTGLSNAAFRLGLPAVADSVAAAGLLRFPDDAGLMVARASALEAGGRSEESLVLLRRVLARTPDDRAALFNAGRILINSGRYAEAVEPLERLTGLAPEDGEAWTNLGVAYMQLERLDQAIVTLGRAIAVAPGLMPAYVNLATLFFHQSRFDEAVGVLETCLDKSPDAARETGVPAMIDAMREAAARARAAGGGATGATAPPAP